MYRQSDSKVLKVVRKWTEKAKSGFKSGPDVLKKEVPTVRPRVTQQVSQVWGITYQVSDFWPGGLREAIE